MPKKHDPKKMDTSMSMKKKKKNGQSMSMKKRREKKISI